MLERELATFDASQRAKKLKSGHAEPLCAIKTKAGTGRGGGGRNL